MFCPRVCPAYRQWLLHVPYIIAFDSNVTNQYFCLEVDFVWSLLALSLNITWDVAYEYTWINRIKVICRPCLLISSEFTSMLMTNTCTWHYKAQAIEMILPFMNDRKFFQWRIWYRPLWFWLCALLCWCSLNTMNWNSTDMVHFISWDWDCLPLILKMGIGPSWKGCLCLSFALTSRNDRTFYLWP